MLRVGVKFCGGCNPRYDRGEALQRIRAACGDVAVFETAAEGSRYDVLLIIRGCTQCPYLYEDIPAGRRIVCKAETDVGNCIEEIRASDCR